MIYKNITMLFALSIMGTALYAEQESQQVTYTALKHLATACNTVAQPVKVKGQEIQALLNKPYAIPQVALLAGAGVLYVVSMHKLWECIRGKGGSYATPILDVIAGVLFIMPATLVTGLFALSVQHMHNSLGEASVLNGCLNS